MQTRENTDTSLGKDTHLYPENRLPVENLAGWLALKALRDTVP